MLCELNRNCWNILKQLVAILHPNHVDLDGRQIWVKKDPITGIGLRSGARPTLKQLGNNPPRRGPQSEVPPVHEVYKALSSLFLLQQSLEIAVNHANSQRVVVVKV